MKLPTRLRVGRKWYVVEQVEEYKNLCGAWRPQDRKILVANCCTFDGYQYTEEEKEVAFWHELTHAILHDMGEKRLNADEEFIDRFAARLTQAIRSAKFE